MSQRHRSRRGFALLAVLWIVTAISAVAMATTLSTREAMDATRNRRAATGARWRALGCIERARAAAEESLRKTARRAIGESAWAGLDTVVRADADCDMIVRAAGTAVDVNDVTSDGLVAALLALGVDSVRALALTDALLDWRDADSTARPAGAEQPWYVAAGRTPPRNADIVARGELALVRGWDHATLREAFDVEAGRVVVGRASPPALASLPGLSPNAAMQLVEARARGVPLGEAATVAAVIAPAERAAFVAAVPEFSARVAPEPDAWIVSATVVGPARATVEERWARSGSRVAVVRRGVGR